MRFTPPTPTVTHRDTSSRVASPTNHRVRIRRPVVRQNGAQTIPLENLAQNSEGLSVIVTFCSGPNSLLACESRIWSLPEGRVGGLTIQAHACAQFGALLLGFPRTSRGCHPHWTSFCGVSQVSRAGSVERSSSWRWGIQVPLEGVRCQSTLRVMRMRSV